MGSRAFLLRLFKGTRLQLKNPSQLTSFCPQVAAMTSQRSKGIKLGAEKLLKSEEAKRCELKPTMEIMRTTSMWCGGRVPTGSIASRHHVKEEVSTPVRRSERLWGMKRKDNKEDSPEPKDYWGGVITPTTAAQARGQPPEGTTRTSSIGRRCLKS
jgi:hypothetical protein